MSSANNKQVQPRCPLLEIITFDERAIMLVVAVTPRDLSVVKKLEVPSFEMMRLVDSEGCVWQPHVQSQGILHRAWWKFFDWLDPTMEVSLRFSRIGSIGVDELKDTIVRAVDAWPDCYKGDLEWYDAVEAVKRADAIGDIIAVMQAWVPRRLPR